MPNLNYNRGRALEYRVMKHFRAEGYEAFRSAGSHSKVDVIAMRKSLVGDECYTSTKVVLIQCKTGKHLMSNKERQEFYSYAEGLGCKGLIAYRETRQLVLE